MAPIPAQGDGMDFNSEEAMHHAKPAHRTTSAALRSALPNWDFLKSLSGSINGLIVWIIAIMVFLTPFVFASWTVEYMRYNKMMFVAFGTGLVVILWAIKIILDKELRLKKTVLDLPILVMVGAGALALLLSKVTSQSLWGDFPNFEDSFLYFVAIIINFYALINALRGGKDWLLMVVMVIASSALLAVVTLLQYFKIYLLPFSSLSHSQLFSPFGTVFQVGFYLAVLVPFASGFLIGSLSNKRWVLSALVAVFMVASFFVFGVIDYWPVWLIASFGVLVSTLISIPVLGKASRKWAFLPLILFVLTLFVFKVNTIRAKIGVTTNPDKPVVLDVSESMSIAQQSLNKYAFTGVGQGNYGYAFKLLRPVEFNQLADWILNYNRPFNQFFMVLTTMGLVGVAALLFFLGKLLLLVVKAVLSYSLQKDADPAVIGLFVSLASYVLVLVLSWETMPLQLLFWILLVLAVYIGFEPDVSGITGDKVFAVNMATDGGTKQRDLLSIAVAIGSIALVAFVCFKLTTVYLVDINLRRAIDSGNAGDTNGSLASQNKVVTDNNATDYDYRGVAILLHNQGIAAAISQDNQAQQQTDIERKRAYFTEAVRFARIAAQKGGLDSENWEVLLGIYSTLSDYGITKIDNVPLSNLMADINTQLSNLTPTEVAWRIRMANYYVNLGDTETGAADTALTLLQAANYLKSNLVDIHYLAAKDFGIKKDYTNALVEANTALRSLAADNAWTTELNKLITDWKAAQAKAGTATTPATTTPPTTPAASTTTTTPGLTTTK